jgi:hypothetical protein
MTMADTKPNQTTTIPGTENQARENWHRYLYGRDRGHLEFMEQARICEGMYLGAGEQWREEDKETLESEGRPWYEFNEVLPSVNSALGYQIQNRMEISFKPRGGESDLDGATIISKVVKQVCDQTALHWKETQVYGDGLIQQRGYYDLRMCFDNNIKGDVDLGTLDPLDVIPDPDSKSYDPDDWADVIVTRWYTLGQIEQYYGRDARDKAEASNDWGPDFGEDDNEPNRNKFGSNRPTGLYDAYTEESDGHKRYRLIDRQMWVHKVVPCIVFPDSGDVIVVEDMTKEQVAQAMAAGAVTAKRLKKRIRWVVSTYAASIFDRTSPYEHFTIVPFFALFRRGKTRGMVDNAVGPQQVLNKSVSQFVHIVNSAANSGWIIEQNSLTNMDADELEENGARTGLVLEIKAGSKTPEKIKPNQVPAGVDKMIDRATQALKDVTVPDSMRGLQGNAVSGVAKQADQFASQQQLAVQHDNLAYTRMLLSVRLLKLIQRYYDSYRVFKITDKDPFTGKEVTDQFEINKFDPATGNYLNDLTRGTYDVVIGEQPMHITFENSQYQQALEMRKEGVNIPDTTVVRYSNLAEKYDIMKDMQPKPSDPTVEAKAKLLEAQARETDAKRTSKAVETQYSAIQTAQVIATTPATSPLADALLLSAGYQDQNAAPIIPNAPAGLPAVAMPANTNPLTPANPAVGMNQGIETPAADGVIA